MPYFNKGNFLIKRVVYEIQEELPNIKHFGTLSPIPGFRDWFTTLDEGVIQNILGKIPYSTVSFLRSLLSFHSWEWLVIIPL